MNWTSLRPIVWSVLFNGVAFLISGNAARNALANRDFLAASIFAVVASAFLCGTLLHAAQHRLAGTVNQRLCAGGIYLFAAFTTALTVDDLMYMSEAAGRSYSGWWRGLLNASLLGSLVLVVAFLAVLIRPRYGYVAALLGTSLSWPYFALLSWHLPWRDFVWLVTIHWDGELQVAAVLSLAIGTVYSLLQLRRMRPALGATRDLKSIDTSTPPTLTGLLL
jgi:hypothetical protein